MSILRFLFRTIKIRVCNCTLGRMKLCQPWEIWSLEPTLCPTSSLLWVMICLEANSISIYSLDVSVGQHVHGMQGRSQGKVGFRRGFSLIFGLCLRIFRNRNGFTGVVSTSTLVLKDTHLNRYTLSPLTLWKSFLLCLPWTTLWTTPLDNPFDSSQRSWISWFHALDFWVALY